MKRYIRSSESDNPEFTSEVDRLKQFIRAIKKDIATMASADSIDDLEGVEWHSMRNQTQYIRKSLDKYDSFEDCMDAWIDSYYELLNQQKDMLNTAIQRQEAIPEIQDCIFDMVDNTSYELVDYTKDKMTFDFKIPENATAEDTYQFVDAVAAATGAKYSGTGRGGSWTTWNLLTPQGVRLDVGYNTSIKGLWHIVIKSY